jgi:hypothetical protein
MWLLFGLFWPLAIVQSHTGAAAVLVDELDLTAIDSRMPIQQINRRRAELETGGLKIDKAPVARSWPSLS